MLAVVREYLAECERQRIQPFEGFINHLDTCSIDTDLDGVPVQSIRVFAIALSRVGLDAQHGGPSRPPISSASARNGISRGRSISLPHSSSKIAREGKSTRANACRGGSSFHDASPQQLSLTGKLVRFCLRYGRRHRAPGKGISEKGTNKRSGVARKGQSKEAKKMVRGKSSVNPSEASSMSIIAPTQRRALAELVDGVRHALDVSREVISYFEFSGFPLHEVPESSARLMRALAFCAQLRTISLSYSSLSTPLFAELTISSQKRFPRLVEASFAGCELTDTCARGLQALVCLQRDSKALSHWQHSLRSPKGDFYLPKGAHSSSVVWGLMRLDISGNHLGDSTLRAIVETLRRDSSLRFLDFSRNIASWEGMQAFILSGVLENSALEAVDLSHNPGCEDSPRGGGGTTWNDWENTLPFFQLPYALGKAFSLVHHGLGQCLLLRQNGEEVSTDSKARSSPMPVQISTSTARNFRRSDGNDTSVTSTRAFPENHLHQASTAAPESSSKQQYCSINSAHSCAFHAPNAAHPVAAGSSRIAADALKNPSMQGHSTAIPSFPPFDKASGRVMEDYDSCHHPSLYYHSPPLLFMMPAMAIPNSGVIACPHCGIIIPSREGQLPPQSNSKFTSIFAASADAFSRERGKPYSPDGKGGKSAPPVNLDRFSGLNGMIYSPTTDSVIALRQEDPATPFGGLQEKETSVKTPDEFLTRGSLGNAKKEGKSEGPLLVDFTSSASEELPNHKETLPKLSLEKDLQRVLNFLTFSMEHQEIQLTERLEKHHQQTTSRLDAFRRDLGEKIVHLSQHQREMESHLIQKLEDSNESCIGNWQKEESHLLSELINLIQAGMERVKRQVGDCTKERPPGGGGGETKSLDAVNTKGSWYFSLSNNNNHKGSGGEGDCRGEFLHEVNTRLKTLGW